MTQFTTWKAGPSTSNRIQSLQLSAVFGSPNRNCAGSGLCRLLPRSFIDRTAFNCPVWPATLIWNTNGRFLLSFEKTHNNTRSIFFHKDLFYVEAPFVFPKWLCKRVNLLSAELPAGWYPVWCNNDAWILPLPLKKEVPYHYKLPKI